MNYGKQRLIEIVETITERTNRAFLPYFEAVIEFIRKIGSLIVVRAKKIYLPFFDGVQRTLRFKRNADEFTLYLLQTVRQTIQKTSLPAIFPIEQVESVARRQLCRRSRGRSARLPRP